MNKEKMIETLNMLIKSNGYCPNGATDYLFGLRSNLFGCYLFDFIDRKTYDELLTLINNALFEVDTTYQDRGL